MIETARSLSVLEEDESFESGSSDSDSFAFDGELPEDLNGSDLKALVASLVNFDPYPDVLSFIRHQHLTP